MAHRRNNVCNMYSGLYIKAFVCDYREDFAGSRFDIDLNIVRLRIFTSREPTLLFLHLTSFYQEEIRQLRNILYVIFFTNFSSSINLYYSWRVRQTSLLANSKFISKERNYYPVNEIVVILDLRAVSKEF